MRRLLRLPAALALPFRVLRVISDEQNARRLARHLHCSVAEARTLYRLARRHGYGAAYESVFPRPGTLQQPGSPELDDGLRRPNRAAAVERHTVHGGVSQVPRA